MSLFPVKCPTVNLNEKWIIKFIKIIILINDYNEGSMLLVQNSLKIKKTPMFSFKTLFFLFRKKSNFKTERFDLKMSSLNIGEFISLLN